MSLSKTLVRSTALISIGAIVARALGLFSAPILTPILGPTPYGVIALLSTVVNLGGTLALFGRELGYSRFGLQGNETERASVEIYLWRSVAISSSAIALLASIWWAATNSEGNPQSQSLAIYLGLALLASPALAMATVRTRLAGDYLRLAIATVLSSAAGVAVSIFWASAISRDAWALASGLLTTALLNFVLLGWPRPEALIRRSGLEKSKRRQVITLGLASVVTAPIYWAIMSLDRWSLMGASGAHEVGVYSFAAQFGLVGALVNNGLMAAWLPETARSYEVAGADALPDIAESFARLFAGLLIIWVGVSAAGGDVLVLISDQQFHRGRELVPWISAGVLLYGLSSLFVASLFIEGKMRFMALAWIAGGLVGVSAYTVLAPQMGSLGVAIGQAGAFGTIAFFTWLASIKVLPLPIPYLRLSAGTAIAIAAVCLSDGPWGENPVLSLALKFPVGLVVAALIAAVTSPITIREAAKWLARFFTIPHKTDGNIES